MEPHSIDFNQMLLFFSSSSLAMQSDIHMKRLKASWCFPLSHIIVLHINSASDLINKVQSGPILHKVIGPEELHNNTNSLNPGGKHLIHAPVFMLIQGYWNIYAQRKSHNIDTWNCVSKVTQKCNSKTRVIITILKCKYWCFQRARGCWRLTHTHTHTLRNKHRVTAELSILTEQHGLFLAKPYMQPQHFLYMARVSLCDTFVSFW